MKYLRQMIADFLRKLIKLDDYIEDRVFTEIRDLATCIDNRAKDIDELENELTEIDKRLANNIDDTECNRADIDDRPTFYDMESQIEELVDDALLRSPYNESSRIENLIERLDKLENFFARWEDFLKEDK
jgi:polyhydroxyalkanoate synthesis regulator phasin